MVSKEEKEDVSCGDCCDKQGEESAARGNELTEMQMWLEGAQKFFFLFLLLGENMEIMEKD